MNKSLLNIIILWKILDNRHKNKIFLIIVLCSLSAGVKYYHYFGIKPLIALITASKGSTNNLSISILNNLDDNYKLIFLGITIIILIIFLNTIKIINLWQINRISASIGTSNWT